VSEYGDEFDRRVETWRVIEAEHDKEHPDRSECDGVGSCSMLAAGFRLRQEMIEALERWRTGSKVAAPNDEPAEFRDRDGDLWRRYEVSRDGRWVGLYRFKCRDETYVEGWTLDRVKDAFGKWGD
jgi:ferredoxin